ncbi:MAG: hypothetical protein ACFFAO_03505 [Candidatus Hermodarchaeota archaeon]
MLYSILILRKSGEPIFTKFFGDASKWNETLTCGLISALYHFANEVLSAKIEDIEVESYRILLEFEEDINLIFVALFDHYDSFVGIKKKLQDLKIILLSDYKEIIKRDFCCADDFKGLDEKIDALISPSSKSDPMKILKPRYVELLKEFRLNEEILDCDLISIETGRPIMHDWQQEFLDLCLRQIDAFYKSVQNLNLDQITLSYRGRHLILHKVTDQLILSTLLQRDTPLGLATLMIENLANKIANIG